MNWTCPVDRGGHVQRTGLDRHPLFKRGVLSSRPGRPEEGDLGVVPSNRVQSGPRRSARPSRPDRDGQGRIAPPLRLVRPEGPGDESATDAAMIRLAEFLADLTADELIRQAREADRAACG